MQSPFEDLPLLLSRKEKIKPAFVEYTAKLTYDLNVYKGLFDSLDSQYQDEPEDVKESFEEDSFEIEPVASEEEVAQKRKPEWAPWPGHKIPR